MIKKYYVDLKSSFHKSIILSLFERGSFDFTIEGLNDDENRKLFPIDNKIKEFKNEIDISKVPTKCIVVYLDESFVIKALVLESNKTYYLFKADHQHASQLNIHSKYISSDLNALLTDYEKHCKNKGKSYYDGEGNFDDIKDLNYFENLYKKAVDKQIDKSSNIYRLTFDANNLFTADFVDLIEKNKINIVNGRTIDKKIFSLSTMQLNKHDRKDCLLIDSESKDIRYLIFTYKPHFVKHFFLLKNLGDNNFEFIKETICFNEIFTSTGIKDLTFKNGSAFSAKSFAKIRYDNFYNEYINFELEEEFDEQVQSELEQVIDIKAIKRDEIIKEALATIKETNMPLDIGVTYHGKERILERIGNMSEEEMLSLVKVAYEKGLTSGHYIEKDPIMFKFLQYQQNKKIGKTLRFYKDILFFYSLEPPHSLVTCFLYQTNFDKYISSEKRK